MDGNSEFIKSAYRMALFFHDTFGSRLLSNIKESPELKDEFNVFSEKMFIENFSTLFYDLVERGQIMEEFLMSDHSQIQSNKYNIIIDKRFASFLSVTIETLKEFHGDGWTESYEKAWSRFKQEIIMTRNLKLLSLSRVAKICTVKSGKNAPAKVSKKAKASNTTNRDCFDEEIILTADSINKAKPHIRIVT